MKNFFYFKENEVKLTKEGLLHLEKDLIKMTFILEEIMPIKLEIENDFIKQLIKEKEERLNKIKKMYFAIKEKKLDKNSIISFKKILKQIIEEEISFYIEYEDFEYEKYLKWLKRKIN